MRLVFVVFVGRCRLVKDMVEAGLDIWTTDVAAGQGLYVPWGCLVAEKTLNGETHAGIR